jgi:hypothetical protein
LHLKSVPDYTTWYRFLARLDPNDIDRDLSEVVRRMPGRRRRRVTVGVDGTDLAAGAGFFFVAMVRVYRIGLRSLIIIPYIKASDRAR